MNNKKTAQEPISEEELIGLLASLRKDPSPEANFEERFIHVFRERVASYAVTRPARKVFWEHLLLRLTNIPKRSWVCCTTTLGLGVLALGFFSLSSDDSEQKKTPTLGSVRVSSQPIAQNDVDKQDAHIISSIKFGGPTILSNVQTAEYVNLSQTALPAKSNSYSTTDLYKVFTYERDAYGVRRENMGDPMTAPKIICPEQQDITPLMIPAN